jgi:hypothetical protein
MRDSLPPLQRAVAGLRVTDGAGGTRGLSRPGFRLPVSERRTSDTATRDARQRAYDSYLEDLTNAWRTPPAGFGGDPTITGAGSRDPIGQREGDLCMIDGEAGHLEMVDGELQCVPDDPDSVDSADHYAIYDAEVSNAWRSK